MPNRASQLVWEEPAAAAGLTRARVVETAFALADAEGLDAVSIRRVAAELGARPMALYTHIASKDDLIALMFNQMSAELLLPEPVPDDWREALREIARRSFTAYLRHPWVLNAIGRRPRVGPNHLLRAEQAAAVVAAMGLEPGNAWTALSLVHEWTMGRALHLVTLCEDTDLIEELRRADPEQFPELSRTLGATGARAPEEDFELALDALLDGIERRFSPC